MVSREPVLLAVAALDFEFGGFEDRRPAELDIRRAWWSDWADGPALLVAGGIGREAARRVVEQAAGRYSLRAVVSTGFVGALAPGWRAGDIFVPERVRDGRTAIEYPVVWAHGADGGRALRRGLLLTTDRVAATASEKRVLRESGADAVDMEASAVAERAAELGLPFFCVRAVSDAADKEFPVDFDRARRPDGTVSGLRVAWMAGVSRRRWKALLELKRDGEWAARELADYLRRCRF